MSDNTSGESKGLFESLSMFGATFVAIVQTRLELLSVDLEEEREHLFSLLLTALAAIFFLGVAVVLVAILIAVAFWENHRLLVLGILAGVFVAAGIAAWAYFMHRVRTKPKLLTSTLSELRKDRQHLSSRS